MAANTPDPRQYLIKSKVYRAASLAFVTIGIFVFAILFAKNVSGRVTEAMREPATILIFLIPFLPAAVLTLLADRFEKKYLQASSSSSK